MSSQSRLVALLLCLFGFLGLHRFYLGRFWTGLFMMVTLGGFLIFWLIDFYSILSGKMTDANNHTLSWLGKRPPKRASLDLKPNEDDPERNIQEVSISFPSPSNQAATANSIEISLPGQMKVATLQERFRNAFGLTLRVYDRQAVASATSPISQVRSKHGAASIILSRDTTISKVENRFIDEFGITVEIYDHDDVNPCDKDLTLEAAGQMQDAKAASARLKAAPKIDAKYEMKLHETEAEKVTANNSTRPRSSQEKSMDFKKLAEETITAVKWATRKEDEEYGGEVLAEKLQEALTTAGYDLDAKPDLYGAWYGIPDDALMELVIAFGENPQMRDDTDPAITRVSSDLYMALEENAHLEEEHPEFWTRARNLLP